MKKGLAELVFILDKSGSMGGLEDDTIGGFNSMLSRQKEAAGECRVTTVLFDNRFEILHDRLDLEAVSPITRREYFVGGSTALLDALGMTIGKITNAQENTSEDHRAEKVLFVIITDGQENASREYSAEKVKGMVEKRKEESGWEFMFLAANIDAVETASHYGISRNRAQEYRSDARGTAAVYGAVSEAAFMFRGAGIEDDWSGSVQDDLEDNS